MEVRESEWKNLAIKNITQYVHRGGESKGDVPQLIGGTDLLNTIGVAMGLPTSNPENWTDSELDKALKGQLVFYDKEAREAIDMVADQIRCCCNGDKTNFVTVLPIEVYFGGKLFELPLFRVHRTSTSHKYYVDNVGRSYDSLSDWYEKNKLPPGEMAYPSDLQLFLKSGSKDARVTFATTPSARWDSQTARGIDAVAAVAGLSASAALIFVSGGLATPLVATALGAAGWGTSRAGYQLVDKATHGETVNPFTNSESRMLWLGIAANLTSFGAMGATMRLSSLAARGREVSAALRIIADVANGTNIAVSGFAILNTTIFMISHHEELTAVDVLMHGASIAFWTKGVFCYKTANTIITESKNYAFSAISKNLSPEEAIEFAKVRNRFENDAQLLQKFHAAMKANISVKDYSQLLIDGMHYYDTVTSLTPEQINAFDGLRLYIRDDINLISGLNRVSTRYNLNPTETLKMVLNMWQQMSASNSNDSGSIILKGGNLIMGRAPPIKIDQLPQLSAPMIKFFGEHLSRSDSATSNQWSVPVLLELQSHGMFTSCPVTNVVNAGNAVVSLNSNLEISVYTLKAMKAEDRIKLFRMVGGLAPGATISALPADVVKFCVTEHRLRFECHRKESVAEVAQYVRDHGSLLSLVEADLKSFEKDRLYTLTRNLEISKAKPYMREMMAFISEMKPVSISELVAYSEFVMTNVENEALTLKQRINDGELILPAGVKKSAWTRDMASKIVFQEGNLMQRYSEVSRMVREHNMVGNVRLERGLSDEQLVKALRERRVAFGSEPSAVYHVLKKPTEPIHEHVNLANRTVSNPKAEWRVSAGQAGDVRSLSCDDDGGTCNLLERDGSVVLATYKPKRK